jgi:hypothetical protein
MLWCERGKQNPNHVTWFSQELVRRGFVRDREGSRMRVIRGLQLQPNVKAHVHPVVYPDKGTKSDSGDTASGS